MTDERDPKHLRLVKALQSAQLKAPAPPRQRTPKAAAGSTIQVSGNGNVVGNGNTVYNAPPPPVKNVVVPKPGIDHITEEQAFELASLVRQIAAESTAVKRVPLTEKDVFSRLKKAMKVESYRMIPLGSFEAAKANLQRQRALTRAMPSAKKKIDGWRASTIGAIHARCREFPDGTERRKAYMLKSLGTDTMTECSDEQLEQVRKHVFGWKR